MPAQVAMESPTAASAAEVTSWTLNDNRLEAKKHSGSGRWSSMGETTGECAAVCCCCPCTILHLLILTVYRLPAGLWRRKKKKKRKSSSEEMENRQSSAGVIYTEEEEEEEGCRGKNDAVHWDKEMHYRLYGAGFRRSPSRKGNDES